MPVFRFTDQIAAGDVNENILAGSKFEFLSRPSAVRVFAVQDAGHLAEMDLTLGNVVVGENLRLNEAAAGTGPSRSDDFAVSGVGRPGDRIQVRLRETGGVAVAVVRVLVEINELA